MPPPRPRGVGYNSGVATARPNPNTPMSERQQMALLIQMTAPSTSEISRSHIKKNDYKRSDDVEEANINEKQANDDAVSNKSISADESTLEKDNSDIGTISDGALSNVCKRNFSDLDDDECDECDDLKKKKRKDSDSSKESKTNSNSRLPARLEKIVKQTSAVKCTSTLNKNVLNEKDQSEPAKSNFSKITENDGEEDDFKMNDIVYSGGLKVPPLKIVIPQQSCSIDTDGNLSRTGKINTNRNAALPYVVSTSNDPNERDVTQCNSPHESPIKINTMCTIIDEKNKSINEEKNLHRVLRSSHRSGVSSLERSSNNSSPQMQSSSPSPASVNANETAESKISYTNLTTSPLQQNQTYEHENIVNLPSPSTSSTSSSKEVHSNIAELHPRKRKMRSKNEESNVKSNPANSIESTSTTSDSHPHDFPFTNCFQMYLNIRRQIEKKSRNLYSVKPRPPQGYNDYILKKRNYLLSINKEKLTANVPNSISAKMRDVYLIQEKERNQLFQRHTVEKEKLCLNVEQEIIRVHSKAARNISCQLVPFSVCTFLKDEEVYNVITPEQEEKDRNARFRFNGRLLLSWLQDVDDKWEKIKESMVLRHHNEAESLHAIQLMDWEIALKKYELCDYKSQLVVDKEHVPIVHVSDDFDLLPA